MKKVTVLFSIATNYVGSRYESEEIFEFDENISQIDMEEEIGDFYEKWVANNNQGGWSIEKEEIIKDEE